jgi:serine/threonine-protein kinase
MLTTVDDQTTGTPAYMAPELITSNAEIDRRADVYSVGCVAYFLLTGQLVFEADTRMKMLIQHLQAEPIPPSQRSELPIPPNLDHLVLSCLHKNPDDRPQDAGDLLQRTYECVPGPGWNQEKARRWWQAHLAEFTGPLQVAATAPSRHRPA